MHKKISLIAGLTALLAMGSAHAQYVCPTVQPEKLTVVNLPLVENVNPETGHTFDIYKADGICWEQAKNFAALQSKTVNTGTGTKVVYGYLATITSSSENKWIVDKVLSPALGLPAPLTKSQVWVGGYKESGESESGQWRWQNNEGPFSDVNGGIGYTNWASVEGEPNNVGGNENWLTLGRYGSTNNLSGWNDEGSNVASIGGFIVEYDTPRTAAECVGTATSTEACTTINGQTLTFPAGTFAPGETIKFTAYEFTDPRVDASGKCRLTTLQEPTRTLTLFKDAAFGGNAELRIPPYLCGSPKFVVVKVDSEDIGAIARGTVFVKNETTEKVLPTNLYKCFDPILGNAAVDTPYAPDPQFQDVVVWQTTDPSKMAENNTTAPVEYVGAATEATNGCGSTTAKVRGASYFLVGMHIDFGNSASDYVSSPLQNYQQFVALTQYKLGLLRKSVDDSRSNGSIQKPDWQAMSSQLKNAINKLSAGDPAGALGAMQQFVFKVNSSTYSSGSSSFNYSGDHLMRGENIVFTLRVKVVPYKPVP